ncbi:hypothetical protein D3C71_1757710 [compost metagenome]
MQQGVDALAVPGHVAYPVGALTQQLQDAFQPVGIAGREVGAAYGGDEQRQAFANHRLVL